MRYRLSFTTGGLFLKEAPVIIACYLQEGDWSTVRAQIRQKNLLQTRTVATATRIGQEVIARLQQLDTSELQTLLESNLQEQAHLLWVAACRRYAFIHDFAIEVLREQHLLLRGSVTLGDYDNFYHSKALWHPELGALATSTRNKLRQNLFRMAREAGLLSDHMEIQPVVLSPRLIRVLARTEPEQFLVFPTTDRQVQRWLQCA